MKGLFVWIQPIVMDYEQTGDMCGNVKAVKDRFLKDSKPEKKKVQTWDGGKSVYLRGRYSTLSVWDGRSKYDSSYA